MTDKNFIYTLMTSFVLVLGACTSEDVSDSFDRTADGTIDFNVGVEASPANRTVTRGGESSASKYYAMKAGTQVRLKVDGTWAGKDPEAISKKTTCTTIAATDAAPTINALSFTENEMLYWDDYGTGDPNNKTNTDNGLKVLGVAVDGMAEAPAVKDTEWESLSWPVITDGKDVLNGDIIVSNNLSTDPYKFVKPTKENVRNMIFVHPLSKITFNLTAADGFTKGSVGATDKKFEKDPRVIMTNATELADTADVSNNYVLATGTVNIQKATAESDGQTSKVIAGTTSITDANITVIKQAVVYPGTQLGADDDAVIAIVNADDNIYYIRAKEIHDAIKTIGGHTDFKTLPGYNYIINVRIKKTGIILTATVTKWVDVNSDEVHPVINVNTSIGGGSEMPAGANVFAFYRSEAIDKGYTNDATPEMEADGTVNWTNTTTLYWTSHYQHYHFRGIYPATTTVVEDATDQTQYVEVANGDYDAATFPSNFVMGMPEIAAGTLCGNPDHTQVDMSIHGICAREAEINLNFRYMMSKVEVLLSSSAEGAHDHVDLSNVKVELVNVYNKGHILLKDRSAVVTGIAADFELPLVDATKHQYLGIIVPQELTYTAAGAATNLRFRITVTNADSTKDIYYADVEPILKKGTTVKVAPEDKWLSGTHYVYNLKVTKTEVKASASLTDWKVEEAEQEVWF